MRSGQQRAAKLVAGIAWAATLSACGGGSGGGTKRAAAPPPVAACDASIEFCGDIPAAADPCADEQYWPFRQRSGHRPFTVHYPELAYRDKAIQLIAEVEKSWNRQVDELGFTAPQSDGGLCGPNGRYDIFIWPGLDGAYVDGIAANPQTRRDDYSTYMAINVGDPDNAPLPATTIAHEFNHSLQASDDWWESPPVYEMTATFVESLVYPDSDDYFYTLRNFQAHPAWSLFYDDNFETWYMYGAAMFLHYLSERYFPGDPAFIARVWRETRSDPAIGRPDYIDAFSTVLLEERGVSLDDAIVGFMQWRWFVADFDDGAHFRLGGDWPRGVAFEAADAAAAQLAVDLEAMVYGAQYLRLVNDSGQARMFSVDLQQGETGVDWRLSTAGGEPVAGTITVMANTDEVIVATVVPEKPVSDRTLDFDLRTAVLTLRAL